jgi:hypothetical protein
VKVERLILQIITGEMKNEEGPSFIKMIRSIGV